MRKIAAATGLAGATLALIGCAVGGAKVAESDPAQGYLDQMNSWVRYKLEHMCGGEGGKIDTVKVTAWNENKEGKATVLITQNTDPPRRGSDAELFRGELNAKPEKEGYRYNDFQPKLYPHSYTTVDVMLSPNGPDPKNNKDDLRRAQVKIVDLQGRVRTEIEVFKRVVANECPKQGQRERSRAPQDQEARDRKVCAEMSTKEREQRCLEDKGLTPTP